MCNTLKELLLNPWCFIAPDTFIRSPVCTPWIAAYSIDMVVTCNRRGGDTHFASLDP
jgi:hypothetical protein